MPTPPTDIANIYGILGAGELSRLDNHPVELLVTLRTISEALPLAPQRIADVGGGPGKYAFALADQGHLVDLVDLSPGLIQLAQVEQDKRKATGKENLLQTFNWKRARPDDSTAWYLRRCTALGTLVSLSRRVGTSRSCR